MAPVSTPHHPGGSGAVGMNGQQAQASSQRLGENEIDAALKDTIQELFDIQAATNGYVDGTDEVLVEKIDALTLSLSNLRRLVTTNSSEQPNGPFASTVSASLPIIPPDIVDYIDLGRNPDIYNRDWVEAVIRYNQNINGKRKAFRDFTDILAEEIRSGGADGNGIPGVGREVGKVMERHRAALEEEGEHR